MHVEVMDQCLFWTIPPFRAFVKSLGLYGNAELHSMVNSKCTVSSTGTFFFLQKEECKKVPYFIAIDLKGESLF